MLTDDLFNDEYFMKIALREAQKAFDQDEVPIGAVIVYDNKILAKAHNLTETLTDVTAHAEMQAITQAQYAIGAKFLIDCTLYVTIEPCVMCAGAIYWSRISKVVYGAAEPKHGFTGKGVDFKPTIKIQSGVMEMECAQIMRDFFKLKRK